MILLECFDSNYNINNLCYDENNNITILEEEKTFLLSKNMISKLNKKIGLINQILDNIELKNKPIILPFNTIKFQDMKFILNFCEIDCNYNEIETFINNINMNDEGVSSINTQNMPKIIKDYFKDYLIYNTINIKELNNIELDYEKLKYLELIIKISDYIQYDILCDITQYIYAENMRIINRDMLQIFIKRKLNTNEYTYELNKILNFINDKTNINDDEFEEFIKLITIIDINIDILKYLYNKKINNIDDIIDEIVNNSINELEQLY
jgi:hypothetical protein